LRAYNNNNNNNNNNNQEDVYSAVDGKQLMEFGVNFWMSMYGNIAVYRGVELHKVPRYIGYTGSPVYFPSPAFPLPVRMQ